METLFISMCPLALAAIVLVLRQAATDRHASPGGQDGRPRDEMRAVLTRLRRDSMRINRI